MNTYIIKQATIINENQSFVSDVLIENGRISKIAPSIEHPQALEIPAEGLHLLPGSIDDQVHFREPGLTHKAEIYTESMAAVAGGTTTFMEMPNTVPNTLTQALLEEKYQIAKHKSWANYSFYMGASNDNLEEVLKTNPQQVCGVKVFMGSSTGNMLVDNDKTLEGIFSNVPMLIATHCEDEATVRRNLEYYTQLKGESLSAQDHPLIRNAEACYLSSSHAVELAKKFNTRLHILHISTEKETHLFRNDIPLEQKRITAEACIHHLWFSEEDYASKGNFIKWNPAVKSVSDREGIWTALLDDRIDVIATDHAPHTIEEKNHPYATAPSGGPLVQHALLAMLDFYQKGKISLEKVVEKTAHAPAICFQIKDRGFIREGYWADLVLVDLKAKTEVTPESLYTKCKWSPFDGQVFNSKISHTFVSGNLIYENGKINTEARNAMRLEFNR